MKKYIIILLLTVLSLFMPTSCLKEYLDKSPDQGLTDAQVFSKLANFKLFYDAVYRGRKYYSGAWRDYNMRVAFPLYFDFWDQKYSWEALTDAADQGRYMEGQPFKAGGMTEGILNKMTYDGVRRPLLESMFTCIRVSNIALVNASKIEDATPEDVNDLIGQAHFSRAFCHFELFRYWGPMPYLTKALGPADQWDIPRLSKHETLMQIAQDMDSAYYYFNLAGKIRRDPLTGSGRLDYNNYQLYRSNGAAAKAYKARALLYAASPLNNELGAADWQNAAAAAWEALQIALNNGFKMQIDLTDRKLNTIGTLTSDEHIWTWSAGNGRAYNNGDFATIMNAIFGNSLSSFSGVCPSQNFVDKYETKWGDPLTTQAERDAATLAGHYNEQDPYANRDPRFNNDIIYNQGPLTGWASGKAQLWFKAGSTTTYGELLNTAYLGWTRTGYYERKRLGDLSIKNPSSPYLSDPLMRLAELYLDYAEASNEAYGPTAIGVAGATMSALDAINLVRARVAMPPVLAAFTGSKDAFRPRIKNERNIELSWEGHYYHDIRRWMDAPAAYSSTMMGVTAEQVTVSATYPTGYKYTRVAVSADRQPAWKPAMYYLPFNTADNLKMKNFVPNPLW